MARRRVTRGAASGDDESRLEHVMLVGGTPEEWDAFDDAAWSERIERLAGIADRVGAPFVTVRPIGGSSRDPAASAVVVHRVEPAPGRRVTVVVDPEPDARTRFARTLAALAAEGAVAAEVTESTLARLLCHAPAEPDLAVILGPSDRLPTSVSWELAYAELVFVDVAWSELSDAHLETAVSQFRQRDRRFGGVDS